ncbi:hypothetical protein, partial [Sphingobium xanthum]
TKRNQTSQRLLAKTLNHNPSNVGIQLLGPNPKFHRQPCGLLAIGNAVERAHHRTRQSCVS